MVQIVLLILFLSSSLVSAQCIQDAVSVNCDSITVTDENGDIIRMSREEIFKGYADTEDGINKRQVWINKAQPRLKRFNTLKTKMEQCLNNKGK